MRDPSKLKAFELADRLAIGVYRTTSEFPKEERFGLTSQLRRAAVSIASNIVEGCARSTERDYVHFLTMAYGSACELSYQLSLAKRLEFSIPEDLQALATDTAKALGALVQSLKPKA
jgi:four helix bundle protein